MTINKEDIKKISHLSRIKVAESESEALAQKLDGIINWVETLNEVNTDSVEPLINVHSQSLRLQKDEVIDGNIAQDVLKNSKEAKYDYFVVPKVLE